MKKRIHVNQLKIRQNAKHGTSDSVITVKTYKNETIKKHEENHYGNRVDILDKDGNVIASIVSTWDSCNRDKLNCGARVWIETSQPVMIDERELVK